MRILLMSVMAVCMLLSSIGCFQVNAPKDVNVNVGGKKENVKYSTDKEYWKNYGKSYTSSDKGDSDEDDD